MEKRAVLLVNLGTPAAAEPAAVKRYLAQFLSDKRVVDLSRWLWLPLLHGIILPTRSTRVARLYRSIWTPEGSPLLSYSRQQQQALAERLPEYLVELAMTYGSPSLEEAIERLQQQDITEIVVLPLFPQYSCSTSAAVWDALSQLLRKQRRLPTLHFIRDYAEHPTYITALSHTVQRSFEQHGEPDLLLFSYHGIPVRYAQLGDDYPDRCQLTTEKVAQALTLQPARYRMSYQSRFGREPWLSPYTDETLQQLPAQGIKHVQVICPGFSVDCLETLEEIVVQNRELFLAAGGEKYHYIPALNAEAQHIDLLEQLISHYFGGVTTV